MNLAVVAFYVQNLSSPISSISIKIGSSFQYLNMILLLFWVKDFPTCVKSFDCRIKTTSAV